MKSQFRNGHKHTDFTKIEEHWTTPHNDCLRNVPVAVLMNSFSASSSDHFIMGMKTQPNVITVGDTTCGAFSAVYNRVLPNGWKFRMVSQVVYNANGKLLCNENGIYLEGIGIAPDYYVPDSWAPIVNGKDVVLDKALKELQHMIQ
jgi:C-terminal processing protease CtpA/Prc